MKKHLLVLLFTIIYMGFPSFSVYGQSMRENWILNSGGSGGLNEQYTQQYADGSVCQMGSFSSGTFNIGPFALDLEGRINLYASRILPSGQVLWVQQFRSNGWDFEITGARIDLEGNMTMIGLFSDTIMSIGDEILESPSTNTSRKYFYAILGPEGEVKALQPLFPFDNTAYINEGFVTWDRAGNMVFCGNFDGDSLYAGDVVLNGIEGYTNFFLMAFDAEGNALWGTMNDTVVPSGASEPWLQMMPSSLGIGMDGSITVAGNYDGDRPVFGSDTLPSPTNGMVLFVLHFDATGNYQWNMTSVPDDWENMQQPGKITPLADGGFYITGNYGPGSMTLGGVSLGDAKRSNYFVYRINADGTVPWALDIPVMNDNYKSNKSFTMNFINDMITDAEENFYILGYYSGDTLDLPGDNHDLIMHKGHNTSQFVAKYDAEGSLLWSQNITSDYDEVPAGLLTADDRLYISSMAYDSIFLPGDTLDFPMNGSMAYLLGLEGMSGTIVSALSIRGSNNSFIEINDLQENIRNNLFILGKFSGSLKIGEITKPALFDDNIFLANFSPNTVMEGKVTTLGGTVPVDEGLVSLIRLSEGAGQAPVRDIAAVTDGSFVFKDFTYGNYLVYVMPNPASLPAAIGTYYGNVPLWWDAEVIEVKEDHIRDINIDVAQIKAELNGEGALGGNLSYATGATKKSTASIQGEPVKKVKVILIGVEKSDNIIAWVYTDDDGNFRFENVPDGNYRIMIDIPGLPMDSTYTISVKGNVITGLDFLVTDKDIRLASPTGISHPAAPMEKMEIWPVPSAGTVTLRTKEMTGGTLTLFDVRGRQVMSLTIDHNEMTLDLSSLPDGIYYLRAVREQRAGVSKLIIQH